MNPSSYLSRVKSKARQLKIKYDDITISTNPLKKFMLTYEGKTTHFGNRGSNDYLILTIEKNPDAEKIRNAYRARHSKIKTKSGKLAIEIPYSSAYWLSLMIVNKLVL